MKKIKPFFSLFFIQLTSFLTSYGVTHAVTFETGEELFLKNCAVCHIQGSNVIIPEKNLKKEALEENGMNNFNAISYQILNGKNGMPAFGERLEENEIEIIARYVLEQSETNFQE